MEIPNELYCINPMTRITYDQWDKLAMTNFNAINFYNQD